MIDLKKEKFKAKLLGKPIDFGFIENRQEFFDWLVENQLAEFMGLHKQRISGHDDFYTYRIFQDFQYTASWIQDHNDICHHRVGGGGTMLVDLEHRAIGYKAVTQNNST